MGKGSPLGKKRPWVLESRGGKEKDNKYLLKRGKKKGGMGGARDPSPTLKSWGVLILCDEKGSKKSQRKGRACPGGWTMFKP